MKRLMLGMAAAATVAAVSVPVSANAQGVYVEPGYRSWWGGPGYGHRYRSWWGGPRAQIYVRPHVRRYYRPYGAYHSYGYQSRGWWGG